MLVLPLAGVAIVDEHGDSHAKDMLPQFESHLESRGDGGDHSDDEEAHDRVREGVVVLLGTLARHMDPADPKARCGCSRALGAMYARHEDCQ